MVQDVFSNTAVRSFEMSGTLQQQYEGLSKTEYNKQETGTEKQTRTFSGKILEEASKVVNKALSSSNTSVEFSVYKPTHEVIVKIKDNETGKVIREIPSKKDLEMAAYMRKLAGIIVDTKI